MDIENSHQLSYYIFIPGEQVNNFLNENWETVLADFGPSVEKTVEKIIKDIFENLSSGVPAKDMFV